MEIHHRVKHPKKARKYREYLFEFLVIFVAITGSYFAENLREHFVDRHKEKTYMESLLQDLKNDSANLAQVIELNKIQVKGLDSLLNLIKNKLSNEEIKKFCQYDLKYALNYTAFNPITRTISELMNTGGLGLVEFKEVSDGIVGYESTKTAVLKQAELLETRYEKIIDQQAEIIDLRSIMKSRQGSSIVPLKEYPPLVTTSIKKMHSFYFNITFFRGAINGYAIRTDALLNQATALIHLIQKKYKL
jgi:hypothetical protein